MSIVTLYNGPSGKYEIETDVHKVKKPERAEQNFAAKNYLRGAAWIFSGLICLGVWLFLVLPAVKPLLYRHDPALAVGSAGVKGYINIAIIFLSLALPVFSMSSIVMLFKSLDRVKTGPRRKTAEDTIKSFIEAIQFGFWEIAYNCLTDTAQHTEVKTFTQDPYLKKRLAKVPFIDSLKDFKKHWNEFAKDISWSVDQIEVGTIDEKTVLFFNPLQYKTVEQASVIANPFREIAFQKKTKHPFIAIKKWKYWYLCNGFLLIDK